MNDTFSGGLGSGAFVEDEEPLQTNPTAGEPPPVYTEAPSDMEQRSRSTSKLKTTLVWGGIAALAIGGGAVAYKVMK